MEMKKRKTYLLIYNYKLKEINLMDLIQVAYLSIKLKELKGKYKHVIVDECQDLSYLEVAVIEDILDNSIWNIRRKVLQNRIINKNVVKVTFFYFIE